MARACQSAVCLHSAPLDLLLPATRASPAAQEATFLPISSSQTLVQPWPKGAETGTSSLQRACPASLCSTFSAAELSCNFLVTVRGSIQKPALDSEGQKTSRGEGEAPGLWRWWCPALGLPAGWAAPVSHPATWLLWCCCHWGFSRRTAHETGSPPLLSPNRK